jgi:predicted Ser/Thr protein kinase
MKSDSLHLISQKTQEDFEKNRILLNYEEYITLFTENPVTQSRGSAQYLVDMLDHFEVSPTTHSFKNVGPNLRHFKIFDSAIDGVAPKIVAQEGVQNQIYRTLKSFAKQKLNNKLILLHGPNGSSKSSMIHSLMAGMERYSQLPEGALYTLNWIFPVDRLVKGRLGFHNETSRKEGLSSYAKIPDEEISARIPCDLKDHPLLLIPSAQRKNFLESLLGTKQANQVWNTLPTYLAQGDLCHRCKLIFNTLLATHQGDFKKVLMHTQIERHYLARRYRQGLVTIEPQLHVDAQYHQLTYNKNFGTLPVSFYSHG